MYEDAQPIAMEIESFVENTVNEISLFSGYEKTAEKLEEAADQAIAYCDGKKQEDIT